MGTTYSAAKYRQTVNTNVLYYLLGPPPTIILNKFEQDAAKKFLKSTDELNKNCSKIFEKYSDYDFGTKNTVETLLPSSDIEYADKLEFNKNGILKDLPYDIMHMLIESKQFLEYSPYTAGSFYDGKHPFIHNGRLAFLGREIRATQEMLKDLQVSSEDVAACEKCKESVKNAFDESVKFAAKLKEKDSQNAENERTVWLMTDEQDIN